jgi:uncharacterized protein YuzE
MTIPHNAFPIEDLNHETEILPGYRFALHRSNGKTSTNSREVSEGVVLDYDAQGNLVGIDIDNASKKVQLKELILSKLPAEVRTGRLTLAREMFDDMYSEITGKINLSSFCGSP